MPVRRAESLHGGRTEPVVDADHIRFSDTADNLSISFAGGAYTITDTRGLTLDATFVHADGAAVATVVVFNGNAGNRSYRAPLAAALAGRGLGVLLFDYRGYVAEATGANIFFVMNGVLQTPTTRNILVGISRQYAIELARGGAISGAASLKSLSFGLEPSLMLAGIGALIGLRACLSLALGAIVAFGLLGPMAMEAGWITPP